MWGIVSAIGEGDEKKALALWEEVCQTDRAAEARAVGGIAFTVRRLLKAKRAEEAGATSGELMRELWIRDGDSFGESWLRSPPRRSSRC